MSVASTPVPAQAPRAKGAGTDERTGGVRLIVRLLQRPELGALLGAVAVYALFATVDATPGHKFSSIAGMQNWTDAASSYGIMAVAVAMLMIGGELDPAAGRVRGERGSSPWDADYALRAQRVDRDPHRPCLCGPGRGDERLHSRPHQAAQLH